jgi:hypothetical protein
MIHPDMAFVKKQDAKICVKSGLVDSTVLDKFETIFAKVRKDSGLPYRCVQPQMEIIMVVDARRMKRTKWRRTKRRTKWRTKWWTKRWRKR